MTHADLREMLGLYALGSLDAHDTVALEAHLQGCTVCREELADLQESADELARVVRPEPPSPEVTRRILEAPRSEPRRPPIRLTAEPSIGIGRPRRSGTAPRPRWRLVRVAASVAVAAVLVMLVRSNINLSGRLDRASSTLARGRELLEFIASPNVVTTSLAAVESLQTTKEKCRGLPRRCCKRRAWSCTALARYPRS